MPLSKKQKKYLARAAVVGGAIASGFALGYGTNKIIGKLALQDPATAQSGLGAGTVSTNGRLQDQDDFAQAPIGNFVRTTAPGNVRTQNTDVQANIGPVDTGAGTGLPGIGRYPRITRPKRERAALEKAMRAQKRATKSKKLLR